MTDVPEPDAEAPGGVAYRMRKLVGGRCANGATILRVKPAEGTCPAGTVIVLAVAHLGTENAEYVTWEGIESDLVSPPTDGDVWGTLAGHYHGRDLVAAMADFEARS